MAKKKSQPTFEESLHKLERIVSDIEEGKIGLEESIQQFEEGMGLVKHCRRILSAAEEKIQKLHLTAEGDLAAEPMASPNTDGDEPV
jgi:exodeoxyribonuclease VII small subunit